MTENDSSNWLFDYGLIENIPVPGGDLPSIDPPGGPIWSSSHSFTDTATLSLEFDQPFGNQNDLTGDESRKRARPTTSYATSSKACREKIRRNKLNDKFTELASILDPGRPLKVDKSVILIDAARMVNQLRDEVQKLKESKERLLENIEELKAEKNELRVEKLKLKTDKENLERQVQSLGAPGFLPHPPAVPVPFSFPGQVGGTKLVPYVGYPGITMWRLMPPAAVDTSQDHALRPPVA